MHDSDKIGKATTSKLMSSKNKRVLNPFPSLVDLMNFATKVVTHLSYEKRVNNLLKICKMIEYPINKPKFDKNITRVSAQHRLMESLLCLNKGLQIYQVQNRGSIRDSVTLMYAKWKKNRYFEAVLNITQVITTTEQYKEHYVASYGIIVRFLT